MSRKHRKPLTMEIKGAMAKRHGCGPGQTVNVVCHWCGVQGQMHWPLRENGSPRRWITLVGLCWDHVIPVFKGGTDQVENIVLACGWCNRSKRNKLVDEWFPDFDQSPKIPYSKQQFAVCD